MATTRVRKAFRYPSESDDTDSPDELDEEHQERLIASLAAEDARKNAFYGKAFLSIPLTGLLFFIYVFIASSTARERLLALLSLSSLAGTAYMLHFMPFKLPDRKGKRALYRVEAERGPVERYLLLLNAALAGLLMLAAVVSWRKGLREDAWRETLPAIVLVLSVVVQRQLAPLDLEDLHKARYEYKGA